MDLTYTLPACLPAYLHPMTQYCPWIGSLWLGVYTQPLTYGYWIVITICSCRDEATDWLLGVQFNCLMKGWVRQLWILSSIYIAAKHASLNILSWYINVNHIARLHRFPKPSGPFQLHLHTYKTRVLIGYANLVSLSIYKVSMYTSPAPGIIHS